MSGETTGPPDHPPGRDLRSSPDRTEVGYGWWPSRRSASVVASAKVSRSGLHSDGRAVAWTESRPDLGGRQVIVSWTPGDGPVVVSPDGVSVRSRVHEYGGGQATLAGDTLYYVDQADQGWFRVALGPGGPGPEPVPGHVPVRLTPEGGDPGVSIRHGDGRLTLSRRWLVCVEEQVGPEETTHRLVAVDTSGSRRVIDLAGGTDFVAAPRPSPDGRWLAWVGWDHPAMPWDRSSLFVAELVESGDEVALGSHRHIAGGPGDGGSSVGQPRWCRDGALLFVDDRTGWWLPYRLPGDVLEAGATGTGPMPAYPLVDREAEFHDPDWALGQSTMAELSDGSLVCRVRESGRDRVVRLVPPPGPDRSPWSEEAVAQPCVSISGLAVSPPTGGPDGEYVVILGSTTTEAHVVIEVAAGASSEPDRGDTPVTDGSGTTEVVRRLSARSSPPVPADEVSVAVPFTAARGALDIPGHLFLPTNPSTTGPAGQLPPLVVFCHGGPTGSTDAGFDPVIQFFTGLGLAVAAVDYRGSSGYGRAYRRALAGLWGEADVDDCVAYASALGEAGLVDPGRMAIRGSSAGGLTALGALIRSDRFAGAVSWYGVTDLAALAGDTHDFESRYLDSLVGPWPEASAVYRDRSPIHQVEAMTGAVLLFQGADDPVVPLDQSERLAAIAASAGIPCSLTVFAGESHGFKRPETIEACLEAELSFYRRLFAGEAGIGGTAPSV